MIKCHFVDRMSFAKLTKNAMRGADTGSSGFGLKLPSFNSSISTQSYSSNEGFDIKKIMMGIAAVTIITILILIVIHYTVTPIFKIKNDGTGIIPVPGTTKSDGELYWTEGPAHGYLDEAKETILQTPTNFTMQMDIYIDDVNAGRNNKLQNRPIFVRYNPAGTLKDPVDYSLGVFMDSNVNDILVIVRTVKQNSQMIKIKNILPKTVTRLGITVGDNYFEVYRNGELVGSRTFIDGIRAGAVGRLWGSPGNPIPDAPPPTTTTTTTTTTSKTGNVSRDTPGFEIAPSSDFTESFQNQTSGTTSLQNKVLNTIQDTCNITQGTGALGAVMNLHIWNRILSPGEIKFAKPKMPERSLFTGEKPSFGSYLNKILP